MKKTGILLALAMVAGSAAATIVFDDATHWANAWEAAGNAGSTLTIPGTDIAGDPGYEFTVNANADQDWGWGTLLGYSQAVVSMGGAAVDTWEVEVKNTHATSATIVQLVGWTSDNAGGGDWTYAQSVVWSATLNPGDSQVLSWDIAATVPAAVSLDALGVMIVGTAAYGTEVTVAMIPEPATLGMVALLGGSILWIRKKFMI